MCTSNTHHVPFSTNKIGTHLTFVFSRDITRMETRPWIDLTLTRYALFATSICNRSKCSILPFCLSRKTVTNQQNTVSSIQFASRIARIHTRTRVHSRVIISFEIFFGIEYKMITNPLIWQVIHSYHLTWYSVLVTIIACYFRRYFNFLFLVRSIFRVFWIIHQELINLLLCQIIQHSIRRQFNELAGNHKVFIYTISTPLTICHRLLPRYTYHRVEAISRVTEIILLVWLIIGHLVAPHSSIWQQSLHQFWVSSTKHISIPLQIFTPCDICHFILIHVE